MRLLDRQPAQLERAGAGKPELRDRAAQRLRILLEDVDAHDLAGAVAQAPQHLGARSRAQHHHGLAGGIGQRRQEMVAVLLAVEDEAQPRRLLLRGETGRWRRVGPSGFLVFAS